MPDFRGAEHGPDDADHWRGLWRKAHIRMNKLEVVISGLLHIKRLADGKSPLMSNQGQALDGSSELANYRTLLAKYEEDR